MDLIPSLHRLYLFFLFPLRTAQVYVNLLTDKEVVPYLGEWFRSRSFHVTRNIRWVQK